MLSKNLRLMSAKSDRANRNLWLPFWMHSLDVAKVSEYLYCTRFAGISEIGGISFEQLKKTIVLLGYLHDIGKLTELFQAKILRSIPAQRSVLEYYSIIFSPFEEFRNKDKSAHALCGESILLNAGFSDDFCSIIGAHHGTPQDANSRKHMESYPPHYYGLKRNSQFWNSIWEEWIDFSLKKAGFASLNEIPMLPKRTQVLLSGLLIMADWIASDQAKFNLIEIEDIPDGNDYPANRFCDAIKQLALPDVWEPEHFTITEEIFRDYFSFCENEIQKNVIKAVSNCKDGGIFILEAPMGKGKTEAAFAAAEILAKKNGKTGVFIGLPTQATANGIFERTVNWAEHLSTEFYHSIRLAHSNAYFQPVFSNIQKGIPQIDEDSDSGLVVHSFFNGSKQSCLADFVVGTVDQLLMCALKKKHAMLLHLGLSQKVVIIDECHAYDAYMNQYLDTALAWLSEYHVPVILLSATLPQKRRSQLINAYLRKEDPPVHLENNYPQLTYSDGKDINQWKIPESEESSTVQIECMDEKTMLSEVENAVMSGGCVGIICNTVSRAQHFANIIGTIKDVNVILYHAQYILPDRAEKEELLKKTIGKNSDISTRKGTVVIGTQVLEQSLDIDFDLLITDLCPMDLLLQRIGRLHRHNRFDRPQLLKNAKCIVLQMEEIDKASENIYSKWLLSRTKSLLPGKICLPHDIAPLVQETYKDFLPEKCEKGSSMTASVEERTIYEEYIELIELKKRKASGFLMGLPADSRRKNNLHGWLDGNVQDQENIAMATVRDGISLVEVIVLAEHSDGSIGLLPWHSKGERYVRSVCPPEEDCKRIAQQKIRLPAMLCQQWNVDKTIRELEESNKYLTGFQKSSWLKGELCLILNEQLSAKLMGCEIKYTKEQGLSCIRENTNFGSE